MTIKVRVLRGVQAGLTGMSGLVVLSGSVAACTNHHDDADDTAVSGESDLTVAAPGNATLSLAYDYGTPSGYSIGATSSSTDEYLRAGEKLSFSVPLHFLWEKLYPNDALPEDITRMEKLSAVITVHFGSSAADKTIATNGALTGSQLYDRAVGTSVFTIAKTATALTFDLVISDAADPTKSATLAAIDTPALPVFGGSLPNKTAIFDTLGSSMRQRVIEGGKPVSGATLDIGYTDWRVATLTDQSSIDRTIGNATSHGRFGAFTMAIQGDLVSEVAYAYAVDSVWSGESDLTANGASRLLPRGRTAYEGSFGVPAGGKDVQVYFHIKTYLVVDYSKFTDVTWQKYNQGDRILVREKWDNENGVVGENYDFPTENR